MLRKIKVYSLAVRDIKNGFQYYQSQQKGLGTRFEKQVHLAFKKIQKFPFSASFSNDTVRYKVMDQFPYIILYEFDDVNIYTSGFQHTSETFELNSTSGKQLKQRGFLVSCSKHRSMPAQNKTNERKVDVADFINSYVDNNQKKADSFQLIELMTKWSGYEPKMWGPTIIGFGSYHYKYASGREGDAPIIGFSPRKAEFSLYVFFPTEDNKHLLENLGKFKMAKACIYIKKLSDINISTLELLCNSSIAYINEHHECSCRELKE